MVEFPGPSRPVPFTLQACLPACLSCYGGSGERGTGWHSLAALALAIVKLANPHLVHHPVPDVVWTQIRPAWVCGEQALGWEVGAGLPLTVGLMLCTLSSISGLCH